MEKEITKEWLEETLGISPGSSRCYVFVINHSMCLEVSFYKGKAKVYLQIDARGHDDPDTYEELQHVKTTRQFSALYELLSGKDLLVWCYETVLKRLNEVNNILNHGQISVKTKNTHTKLKSFYEKASANLTPLLFT